MWVLLLGHTMCCGMRLSPEHVCRGVPARGQVLTARWAGAACVCVDLDRSGTRTALQWLGAWHGCKAYAMEQQVRDRLVVVVLE